MKFHDAFRAYLHASNGLRSEHEGYTVDTWNAALEAAAVRLEEARATWRPDIIDHPAIVRDLKVTE